MNSPAAFPIIETAPDGSQSIETGMTLRDYFAAKAMQICLADALRNGSVQDENMCAKFAYEMADAMLTERERGGKK